MIPGSSYSNSYLPSTVSDNTEITKVQKQPRQELSEGKCVQKSTVAVVSGVGIIKYACLADSCQEQFEKWNNARRHMKNVCCIAGKPMLSDSAKKARDLFSTTMPDYVDPTLEARFSGQLKTNYAPSEKELVDLVKEYYLKGPYSVNYRRYVMARIIRPTYGNFEFERFGFGTFREFVTRHGL